MLVEYGQEPEPVSLGRPDVREAVTRMQDLASYLSVLNAAAAHWERDGKGVIASLGGYVREFSDILSLGDTESSA
jgi:hypothetical protein